MKNPLDKDDSSDDCAEEEVQEKLVINNGIAGLKSGGFFFHPQDPRFTGIPSIINPIKCQ